MKIKKVLLVLLILVCLFSGCTKKENPTTLTHEETRAIWISYIDFTQILWGKSESEFSYHVDKIMENIETLKINTIYVHASAFTDAYYKSDLYPTAQYITGNIGETLPFDPLAIFINKAKAKNIRIEAWVNPFRSFTKEQMNTVPDKYQIKQWVNEKSRKIVYYQDRYYLNPAYHEVETLILGMVEELVTQYDIDGIHMDDYFYPDQVTGEFDAKEYKNSKTTLSVGDWRRQNVNTMIQSISTKIKKLNSKCSFSISPAGNIEYTTNSIYGDVKTWIKNDWIDAVVPQIYFGYEHEALPFDVCLKQWENLVEGTDVELIIGLAAYKINKTDDYAKSGKLEWRNEEDIIARQIEDARKAANYHGYALFSYNSIFYVEPEDSKLVESQILHILEILD